MINIYRRAPLYMHPSNTLHSNNENRTPDTRGSGQIVSQDLLRPGGHIKNVAQNHSTTPPSKNPAEILPDQVIHTPHIPEKNTTEVAPYKDYIVNKTQYDPTFGPKMYAWFAGKEKFRKGTDTYVWKNGEVKEKYVDIVLPPPHFSEFARSIGVTWNTLKRWRKAHKEFAEYYDACEDIIQEFMIDNGVTGKYSSQMTIFAAKNTTKMKDVQENINKTVNFKDVLDAIEKGSTIDESQF